MHGFLTRLPGVRFVVVYLLRRMGIYVVSDYGLRSSYASTYATANTTALAALWVTAAATGGVVYFPTGGWGLNATTLDHGTNNSVSLSILGAGPSSQINFYGTTGPFLDIATSSTSRLDRVFLRNIRIDHAESVTSAATIQVSSVNGFEFDGVKMVHGGDSGEKGALVCVRLAGTATGISFRDCKFETRTDRATMVSGGLTPIGLDVANSSAMGGLYMERTEWNGCYLSSATGLGIGVRFANSALVDTVWMGPGTLIKDWNTGIAKTSGAGGIANFTATGIHVDGCATVGVQLEPTAATLGTFLFDACWFSADGYDVLITENGGTVSSLTFVGCYMTNAITQGVLIGAGVDTVIFANNIVLTSVDTGGGIGVQIGTGSASANVVFTGNIVTVGSSSTYAYSLGSGITSGVCVGNLARGAAGSAATTSTAWINENNAYLA